MTWHTPPPSYAALPFSDYNYIAVTTFAFSHASLPAKQTFFTMSDPDNMNEDHIISVCHEQVSIHTTPMRQSSSSSNEFVIISVDEISVCLEDTTNVTTHPEATAFSSGETRQCRFCHEEDLVRNLEAPCACMGTMRYAHRSCTTGWCNTKGNILCEICHQPYGPDYAVTTEVSSSQTRVVVDSPSTPTTITQVESPNLQQQNQRAPALTQWATYMVSCRGLLYATLLVLFLLTLVVNDVISFTKTTKNEPEKAFNIIFVVIMMLLAPFSVLSCLYECQAMIAEHLQERNQRAVEGENRASLAASERSSIF